MTSEYEIGGPVVQCCDEMMTASVLAPTGSAQPDGIFERNCCARPLDAPNTVASADALTTKAREGGRVNVHAPVATGVNACARTGSLVPIIGEPFRQGREHGHGRFRPLLQDGV